MSGRRRRVTAVVLVAAVFVSTVGSLVSASPSGASAPKSASVPASPLLSASTLPKVHAARLTADSSTSPPSIPFITGTVPEGLGLLVNWNPNPTTDDVTGYTLTAIVAPGFATKVSKTCASPAAFSAPGTDSSALIPKLCAGVPYTVTMTATNAGGTSAASAASNPTVPLVAQPPSAPLITSVFSRNGGLVLGWSAPLSTVVTR